MYTIFSVDPHHTVCDGTKATNKEEKKENNNNEIYYNVSCLLQMPFDRIAIWKQAGRGTARNKYTDKERDRWSRSLCYSDDF